MCKNFAAFAAGAAALSFLGLGSRIFVIDSITGTKVQAVCPICGIVLWIATFAMPFVVGLFIGLLGGQRGWVCAGLAAFTALVIRSLVAGPQLDKMIHTPVLAELSALYIALAVFGGLIGAKIASKRLPARERYIPIPVPAHTPGTAQSHSHDNIAF